MKAGIVLDDWKLPIFRRRLTAAGFEYADTGYVMPNTTVLTIKTDNMAALGEVIAECEAEARETRLTM